MLPLWPDYPMRSVLIDHNKVWRRTLHKLHPLELLNSCATDDLGCHPCAIRGPKVPKVYHFGNLDGSHDRAQSKCDSNHSRFLHGPPFGYQLDRSHIVDRKRSICPRKQNRQFLAWRPTTPDEPPA